MTILCVERDCTVTAPYPLPEHHAWGDVVKMTNPFEHEGLVAHALGYCPEHNAKRATAHAVPMAEETQGTLL